MPRAGAWHRMPDDERNEDTLTTEDFAEPVTGGPWTVTDGPNLMQYIVVGEEGGETLLIHGHGVAEDHIAAVIRHAGFGQILDPIMFQGEPISDGTTVAELRPFETWAREVRGCPRHRWLPWWLRHGVIRPVDWVRWQAFRLLWRTWRRRGRDHRELSSVPRWLLWLGRSWCAFSDCAVCEYVDHYRTCSGCGFCSSDGTGRVPPWWDWDIPKGSARDANASRPGYPVTVIELEA